MTHRESISLNRAHWNHVSATHAATDFYDVNSVIRGSCSLSRIEQGEIGEIAGQRGIHLQCGIGLDTISLARLGAAMTGVDFARSAITTAKSVSQRSGTSIKFIARDIYSLGRQHDGNFDFVYTSHGALRWLPDLPGWASAVRRLLRSGGFFYIYEIHPLVFRTASVSDERYVLKGDYFRRRVVRRRLTATHALPHLEHHGTVAHMDWTIADVVSSLVQVGLQLQFFHEHRGTSYSRNGMFPVKKDQLWYAKRSTSPIPTAFSLKAKAQ